MKKGKVYVGVSGGVDSSVAAFLLKKQGYEVIGVYISIAINNCENNEYKQKAMDVCAKLKIPFRMIEATEDYKEKILYYFIDSYRKGLTPNPDVLCNKFIKVGLLFEYIKKDGGRLAFGHYVSVVEKDEELYFKTPKDKDKDQTYFLWAVDKSRLKNLIFPLSNLDKKEVRQIARKNNLPSAETKESMGLCFVGDIDLGGFLQNHIESKKGRLILLPENREVGTHNGVQLYTLSQRHGFDLSEPIGPLYVVKKDLQNNVLFVSTKEKLDSFKQKEYYLKKINKFTNNIEKEVFARYRHQGKFHKARVDKQKIMFEESQLIAEGQSIVVYDKQGHLLQGGVVGTS